MEQYADGPRLKIAVTAPPEGGKANAAIIKLLAKSWRMAKTALEIVAGATDRNKTLLITGDQAVIERVSRWLADTCPSSMEDIKTSERTGDERDDYRR